ncbi:MAG: dCTP deaminase [Candidatus Moranbacteria bacterium]|nr:dCTP deaminase [Candidatus Moranbacteria bacterium]
MILSDRDIKKELKSKEITIKPFKMECLQPASYDVHLDRHFLIFNTNQHFVIDPRDIPKDLMKKIIITKTEPFILHPGEFALGVLLEETGVSDKLVGRLEGKSSLGRLGLIIHTTAGFLDAGNSLKMTLELFNAGKIPLKLHYGMPIGQMAFEYLSSPCIRPYGSQGLNSKYKGDTKPMASKMHLNFKKKSLSK